MPVSAVDCVQPAIQHTRDQLFQPFRLDQWMRLALVGILTAELHTSGCNFSLPTRSHPHRSLHLPFPTHHPAAIDPARLAQFAGLIIFGVLVGMIVGLVLLYIGSVFRFILFDAVVRKHCSISQGWRRWRHAGRRFFLWQIVFLVAQGLCFGLLIAVPLAIAAALGWFRNVDQHIARTIFGVVFLASLFLLCVLVAVIIQVLAKDFLVPVMALDDVDFADAWSRLLTLIDVEPGNYVIYLLLKLVLAIAAAIIFGILSFIPIFLMALPALVAIVASYRSGIHWTAATIGFAIVSGVLLLTLLVYLVAIICVPATVFFPAFSIHFFASRYPKLGTLLYPSASPVSPEAATPAPSSEPPILPPSPEPIG